MQWIFLFVCKHLGFVRIKLLEAEILIECERIFLKLLTLYKVLCKKMIGNSHPYYVWTICEFTDFLILDIII